MRKGFCLVELLAVMVVLAFFLIGLAGLFTTVITDIPRCYRVIQANTTMLNMLKQMRQDIDAAKELPGRFGEFTADNKLLLIETTDDIICYQARDNKLLRRKLTSAAESSKENIRVWSVPHGKIQWKVWEKDGKGYALEITTYIEREVRGHRERKMANSHLFFAGALPKALK